MNFVNGVLFKEIMTRARLQKQFFKRQGWGKNKRKCSKQRNYCVSLISKSKSEYFGNLNQKKSAITKHSGKPLSPFYWIRGRENVTRPILLTNSKVICRWSLHFLLYLNTEAMQLMCTVKGCHHKFVRFLCWSQLLKQGQAGRWIEREAYDFNVIVLNFFIKTS